MTNLMQRLQAWADEWRYDFENKTFNSEGIDFKSPSLIFPFSKNYSLDKLYPLVLDGTIQVWRPVEFYRPPEDIILCLSSGLGRRTGIVKREEDGYWLPTLESPFAKAVKITHWQPLPALPPPKEGE
jgi:hypothetical protein